MNGTKRARLCSEDVEDDTQKELIVKLEAIQKDIDSLNVSAAQDIIKIEEVYTKRRKVHFELRSDVLKTIPRFWVTVFQNHPHMSMIMKDEDIDCLVHLINVTVDENEKIGSGYRINFHFEANPFFENEIITKEFSLQPSGKYSLPESTTTPILWKEGKALPKTVEKPKGRKRHHDRRSFFYWIQDNSDAENDDIAEIIKEELWFNPLQFYWLVADDPLSSELKKNGAVDDGDGDNDEVEIIDEEEVEEEEEDEDEELDEEEEVEDEELLEEDGNEEEVTVIVDEEDECETL